MPPLGRRDRALARISDATRTEITYRYDRFRAVAGGIIETAGTTFLLLIAVRVFHAGPTAKALIVSGGAIGHILSPFAVAMVERGRWEASRAAAGISFFGAACFAVAALFPSLPVFVIASVAGMTAANAVIPMLTQMYQENYSDRERGSRFSAAMMIRIAVSAAFSWVAGGWLSGRMDARYPWLLACFALAYAYNGFCLSRCPTRALRPERGMSLFRGLKYVKSDRSFRWVLASWMLMGFGNLMMWPLRVEFLANPKYGTDYSAVTIAVLTGVIPNVARFIMIPFWGRLFDRMNFFHLRAVLNVGFAIGILAFFGGQSMPWLVFAAIMFGISNAGGDLAWSLWVTKLAPPARVADYMSVHTFNTGTRSLIAPLIAFNAIQGMPMWVLGIISVALILASSALLVFESGRTVAGGKLKGTPLVEEGGD
jgi:MFS family permease